jgi:hypothetical protein
MGWESLFWRQTERAGASGLLGRLCTAHKGLPLAIQQGGCIHHQHLPLSPTKSCLSLGWLWGRTGLPAGGFHQPLSLTGEMDRNLRESGQRRSFK